MARLRERMYSAALQQEVEYVERGEGDVLSRLSVDSNIVGDRYVVPTPKSSAYTLSANFVLHFPYGYLLVTKEVTQLID